MLASEFIDQVFTDVGEPTDGTGFWTRAEALTELERINQEVARLARYLIKTGKVTAQPFTREYSLPSDGIELLHYGARFKHKPIEIIDLQRLEYLDYQWSKRLGTPVAIFQESDPAKFLSYPVPRGTDTFPDNYFEFFYVRKAVELTLETQTLEFPPGHTEGLIAGVKAGLHTKDRDGKYAKMAETELKEYYATVNEIEREAIAKRQPRIRTIQKRVNNHARTYAEALFGHGVSIPSGDAVMWDYGGYGQSYGSFYGNS